MVEITHRLRSSGSTFMYLYHLISIDLQSSRSFNTHTAKAYNIYRHTVEVRLVYAIAWIKLLIKGSSARRKISRGGVNKVIKFILNYIKNRLLLILKIILIRLLIASNSFLLFCSTLILILILIYLKLLGYSNYWLPLGSFPVVINIGLPPVRS
jgi:hypothetical protein